MPTYTISTRSLKGVIIETNKDGEVVGIGGTKLFLLGWKIGKVIRWINKKEGVIRKIW